MSSAHLPQLCQARHSTGHSTWTPTVFVIINDLPSNIDSAIKLYADDVLMFRGIYSSTDQQTLQKDIEKLAQWSAVWQMPLT